MSRRASKPARRPGRRRAVRRAPVRAAAATIRFDAPLSSYTAAAGFLESVLLGACSQVDRFVLDRFIRRRPIVPAVGLQDRVRRAIRFYGNPRFISEPETFFRPPTDPTVWERARLPLPGGELVSLEYETDFVPA